MAELAFSSSGRMWYFDTMGGGGKYFDKPDLAGPTSHVVLKKRSPVVISPIPSTVIQG